MLLLPSTSHEGSKPSSVGRVDVPDLQVPPGATQHGDTLRHHTGDPTTSTTTSAPQPSSARGPAGCVPRAWGPRGCRSAHRAEGFGHRSRSSMPSTTITLPRPVLRHPRGVDAQAACPLIRRARRTRDPPAQAVHDLAERAVDARHHLADSASGTLRPRDSGADSSSRRRHREVRPLLAALLRVVGAWRRRSTSSRGRRAPLASVEVAVDHPVTDVQRRPGESVVTPGRAYVPPVIRGRSRSAVAVQGRQVQLAPPDVQVRAADVASETRTTMAPGPGPAPVLLDPMRLPVP